MPLQKNGCPTDTTVEAPHTQKNYLTGRVADMRNFVNIPQRLIEYPCWVVWLEVPKPNPDDLIPPPMDKVPYNPKTGGKAMVNNSSTWGTFKQACETFKSGNYTGIGLVLHKSYGIACIDIDDSYFDGKLSELAQKYMRKYPSWTEISNGGHGIHIWILLPRNFDPKRKKLRTDAGVVEIYTGDRYIAITGNVIGDEQNLNYFGEESFDWCGSASATPQLTHHPEFDSDLHSNDCKTSREERRFADSLFEKNPNFKKLWQGDFSSVINGNTGRVDRSAIDFIVACELNKSISKVYKNFGDKYKLIRKLMLSNKFLTREKWFEDRPDYHDYLHMTIHRAMLQNVNYRRES